MATAHVIRPKGTSDILEQLYPHFMYYTLYTSGPVYYTPVYRPLRYYTVVYYTSVCSTPYYVRIITPVYFPQYIYIPVFYTQYIIPNTRYVTSDSTLLTLYPQYTYPFLL